MTYTTVNRSQLDRDKQAGVFPGKMCLDRRKNHGCERKNQKALALLCLIWRSRPLQNAVNSSDVPTYVVRSRTP